MINNIEYTRELLDRTKKLIRESTDFFMEKPTKASSVVLFAKKKGWTVEGPKNLKSQDGMKIILYTLSPDGQNLCELYVDEKGIITQSTLRGENPEILTKMVDEISANFGGISYEG